jgi:hypothetical protein
MMFVPSQVNAVVLCHFQLAVILYLKRGLAQWSERVFFIGQELFFPRIGFLLHTGLIMIPRFVCKCLI